MTHLDTSTVIAYFRGNSKVADRLEAALPEVGISCVVLGELFLGAGLSARASENLDRIREFIMVAAPIPFDATAAEQFGIVQSHLRRIGKPTGEIDALIGAAAVAHHARLVTANRRHFENIPNLMLEDWTA